MCSLLRRDQIHQTRSWYEDNRSLDVLKMRGPSLVGRYLADQLRRHDPKAIVLNESYDARINIPGIEQPENYLLISQVGFVNHRGATQGSPLSYASTLGCRGLVRSAIGTTGQRISLIYAFSIKALRA